jgi:hypothetical protein
LGFSYTYDLSSLTSVKGLSLNPSLTFGWLHANRSDGGQTSWVGNPRGPHQNWRNSYGYYSFKLNLNYAINSWATAFVGFRVSGNNDGNGKVPVGATAQTPGSGESVWGGAGVNFSD